MSAAVSVENVEFDCPFKVYPDGRVEPWPDGPVEPETYLSVPDDTEPTRQSAWGDDACEWVPLTGYTGQYGYHGAVMHNSEFIDDEFVRRNLAPDGESVDPLRGEEFAVYVKTVCHWETNGAGEPLKWDEDDVEGWVIWRLEDV